jgi:hypothetical protein
MSWHLAYPGPEKAITLIYPSKIDWWLAAILALVGLGMSVAGIVGVVLPLLQPGITVFPALVGLIILPLGMLVLWQLASTGYEITATDLIMKSGPFRWTLALDQIIEVYSTRNPPRHAPGFTLIDHFRGNHPALSLDRLRVNYRYGGQIKFYLISPLDKSGFLHEMAQAVPGLQVTRDGATRSLCRKGGSER